MLKRLEKSTTPIDTDRYAQHINQLSETFVKSNSFEEAYYGSAESPTAKELAEAAMEYLTLFLQSERYEWICALPEATRKTWMIEPGGFGETRINNLKAYCKVDFLLQNEDKTYIFDWKTGKADPEKHARQMLGYALFAHVNLGVGFGQIKLVLHYLRGGETELGIEERDLPDFEFKVHSDTQDMYSYCEQVENNIPKPKEYFPMVESERLCGYCKFRELCGRG